MSLQSHHNSLADQHRSHHTDKSLVMKHSNDDLSGTRAAQNVQPFTQRQSSFISPFNPSVDRGEPAATDRSAWQANQFPVQAETPSADLVCSGDEGFGLDACGSVA